jgi:hypothetical protein
MVRRAEAVLTHIHCSLRAFIILQFNKLKGTIKSERQLRMRLYNRICRMFLYALHDLDGENNFLTQRQPRLFSQYEFW